ncbi:MAG: diaminopimelate decarboxylase family protein [bacterium]
MRGDSTILTGDVPIPIETAAEPLNILTPSLIEQAVLRFGLPLHIIFKERFLRNVKQFREVLGRNYPHSFIAFAVKSNPCRGAVRMAAEQGLGADVASEWELRVTLEEIPQDRFIICNGNAKSDEYLKLAMRMGCFIAVDSLFEWQRLKELAYQEEHTPRILLRVSGLPTEGWTDPQQNTAQRWTKFGIHWEIIPDLVKEVANDQRAIWEGLSVHLGTQICDPKAYQILVHSIYQLLRELYTSGYPARTIDLGGGYPINFLSQEEWKEFRHRLWRQISTQLPPEEWVTWGGFPMGYEREIHPVQGQWKAPNNKTGETHPLAPSSSSSSDSLPAWSGKSYWSPYPKERMVEIMLNFTMEDGLLFKQGLKAIGEPQLIIEPGRALIGSAGVTIARVLGTKRVMGNWLVVADLGIVNHGTLLVTPDIHPIEIYPPHQDDQPVEVFIAGRLCFTGDMVSKVKVRINRLPQRDEWLVIHHTGAYCADHFASHNCGFPLPPKVAIDEEGNFQLWRREENFSTLFPPI